MKKKNKKELERWKKTNRWHPDVRNCWGIVMTEPVKYCQIHNRLYTNKCLKCTLEENEKLRSALITLHCPGRGGWCWCNEYYDYEKYGHSIACCKVAEVLGIELVEVKKEVLND